MPASKAGGRPIRLVHTADLHIGIENYGRWNPATGLHARLEDFLASLDQVVAFAIAYEADVFLVAGDIYKTKDPTPTQQREFAKRVHRLTSSGIHVVLLVGNHDQPARHGDANPLDIYASLELPDVTILHRPELKTISTRGGLLQVAGIPHVARGFLLSRLAHLPRTLEESERLLETKLDDFIHAVAEDIDPELPAILTAHLSIDCATLGSERDLMLGKGLTLPLTTLALPAFDYVAMGHIHKPQVLGESPACVYPGSLDRIDFGEESDTKGFMVVEVARGATTYRRELINVRPFRTIRVDLFDSDHPTDDLVAAIARADVAGAVVRLAYVLQAERANAIDQAVVDEALTEAFDVAWRPELIQGAARGRQPELTQALSGSPMIALEKFMAMRPELAKRSERLLAGARELIAAGDVPEPSL